MADQTMPYRPHFDLCAADLPTEGPLLDTDGQPWTRVVLASGAVCAAETPDGVLYVWDQAELFEAVFRAVEQHD